MKLKSKVRLVVKKRQPKPEDEEIQLHFRPLDGPQADRYRWKTGQGVACGASDNQQVYFTNTVENTTCEACLSWLKERGR